VYKLWACHGNFIGQSTAVTQELEIEKVTCQKNKTLIKVTVLSMLTLLTIYVFKSIKYDLIDKGNLL